MINNLQYKLYATQIASLFCGSDNLCKTSVKSRIITDFDDTMFENYFLPHLNQGRFSKIRVTNEEWVSKNFYKVYVENYDIVTGETGSGFMIARVEVLHPNTINQLFKERNWDIISDNPIFTVENMYDWRVIWSKNDTGYGIVFVPHEIGSGGGSNGGGGNGGQIVVTPENNQPVNTPNVTSSFDLQSIISNPIFLIAGAGLLLFFLMKD